MSTLEVGAKENAPQPIGRQTRDTSQNQNPLFKPNLRNFQVLKEIPHSGTHGRYFLRSNVSLPSCTDAA